MSVRAGSLGAKQLKIVVRTHWVPKQQALRVRAIERLQERQLIFSLNALRYHVHFQTLAHVNDRANNRCVVRIHSDILHE